MSAFPFPPCRPVGPGSTLAIIAPSGPFDQARFRLGVNWLATRYALRYEDPGIFSRTGYLAGADGRRLAELQSALEDPSVDAIVCARGGYGSTRLLPGLETGAIAAAGKLLVGFSDITALHALWARAGVRSLHAPMVASLGGAGESLRRLWIEAVEGSAASRSWPGIEWVPGTAEGRLIGGNLAVLAALAGTPYEPPVEGCVLFLEDVGERPYRIDRMLTTLRQSGWLGRCAGFLIGEFTDCGPGEDGVTVEEVIRDRLGDLGVPVVAGIPAGHVDHNEPLPFGALATVGGGRVAVASGR